MIGDALGGLTAFVEVFRGDLLQLLHCIVHKTRNEVSSNKKAFRR